MKERILFTIIIIALFLLLVIEAIQINYLQKEQSWTRTETKAFCNTTLYCTDYLLFWNNDNLINMTATSYSIQLPK